MGYKPTRIPSFKTGLVQQFPAFDIPDDGFTELTNAWIYRGRLTRKRGGRFVGVDAPSSRLRRTFTATAIGNATADPFSFNLFTALSIDKTVTELDAEFEAGSVVITVAAPSASTFTDQGDGTFSGSNVAAGSTINYQTGDVVLNFTTFGGASAMTVTCGYFPTLPCMGLRQRELAAFNAEDTIAFDTKYAYQRAGGKWAEFITGTTWSGTNANFFWSTNWSSVANNKLFWATNFSGTTGDPIRYTDGLTWTDFSPDVVNTGATQLRQCLAFLPFRSRLVCVNTYEGATLAGATHYPNRIRWSAIGNPLDLSAWYDNVNGKGGYIDVPTAQAITGMAFLRDNMVIYCERSTWQLRYTGIASSPFQIEKINAELGTDSPFSTVLFDTEVLACADKGVTSCDSFSVARIDEDKIPDLVIQMFNNDYQGRMRVHGVRDYLNRVVYWTYPNSAEDATFPNRRLVYNYLDKSWAVFTDNYTCLGVYQGQSDLTWEQATMTWEEAQFTWQSEQSYQPDIIGGTQQGYTLVLDQLSINESSLSIQDITGNTTTPTSLKVRNHNLVVGQVIKISGIPTGSPFSSSLNDGVFGVYEVVDGDNFLIAKYSASTGQFDDPQLDAAATYIGGGTIAILDNFVAASKKYSYMSQGQQIQIGYLDLLTETTDAGGFTLQMISDYAEEPSNQGEDSFFNTVVDTTASSFSVRPTTQVWQRVICPVNANFLQTVFTLSNAQMAGEEQAYTVVISAAVVWDRLGGRMTP